LRCFNPPLALIGKGQEQIAVAIVSQPGRDGAKVVGALLKKRCGLELVLRCSRHFDSPLMSLGHRSGCSSIHISAGKNLAKARRSTVFCFEHLCRPVGRLEAGITPG